LVAFDSRNLIHIISNSSSFNGDLRLFRFSRGPSLQYRTVATVILYAKLDALGLVHVTTITTVIGGGGGGGGGQVGILGCGRGRRELVRAATTLCSNSLVRGSSSTLDRRSYRKGRLLGRVRVTTRNHTAVC